MNAGRRHSRTKLKRNCHLVGRDGDAHPTTLVDISVSGALVKTHSKFKLKIGDLCEFVLNLKTAEVPVKRPCEIVRLDGEIIGVTFLPLPSAQIPPRLIR